MEHELNSKSDQKSSESIDQPNRKSTKKLQDVKSIVCINEIKLPKIPCNTNYFLKFKQ